MLYACTVEALRAAEQAVIDREGPDILMQRAAAGLAAVAAGLLAHRPGRVYGASVVVLVGPGNNGGDALYAGARLARRGARVSAVRCLGSPHGPGLAALLVAGGRVLDLDALPALPPADLVIDGILGIGGRPGLPPALVSVAEALERAGTPVLAVDLPSGVDADSGAVPGAAFRAQHTVTFGLRKPCHLVEPARSRCGEITVVDIGLGVVPVEVSLIAMTSDDLAANWPYPAAAGDKYSRGVVGVDTGSDTYPGAALLSTLGAVYGGAGMVRYLGADRPAKLIESELPNVVFAPGRVQAHLVGSGWGERADGAETLARIAGSGEPAVIDADGLRHLPDPAPANWLLTPHAGELAALLGVQRSWVSDDPIRAVRAGVERTGATVLLKGATQLVQRPGDPNVYVALPGPAWTGQAGSGDVLGGVCAALLAAGVPPHRAGQLGASIQAAAAAVRPGVVPPQELARTIGSLLGDLERRRDEPTVEEP